MVIPPPVFLEKATMQLSNVSIQGKKKLKIQHFPVTENFGKKKRPLPIKLQLPKPPTRIWSSAQKQF